MTLFAFTEQNTVCMAVNFFVQFSSNGITMNTKLIEIYISSFVHFTKRVNVLTVKTVILVTFVSKFQI